MGTAGDGPGWLSETRSTLVGRVTLWYMVSLFTSLLVAEVWRELGLGWFEGMAVWPAVTSFGPILVVNAVFVVWMRRIRRRAAALDYRMCKHCGYDLRATEDGGPCPECGRAFDAAALARYWKWSM